MDSIDGIKSIIRSLVISSKKTLTVSQLISDYEELEGDKFPFQKFGCKSPESFLRHQMEDVVRICGYGNLATLTPVVNERTVHIAQMVKEQKCSYKKQKSSRSHKFQRTKLYYNFQYQQNKEQLAVTAFPENNCKPLANTDTYQRSTVVKRAGNVNDSRCESMNLAPKVTENKNSRNLANNVNSEISNKYIKLKMIEGIDYIEKSKMLSIEQSVISSIDVNGNKSCYDVKNKSNNDKNIKLNEIETTKSCIKVDNKLKSEDYKQQTFLGAEICDGAENDDPAKNKLCKRSIILDILRRYQQEISQAVNTETVEKHDKIDIELESGRNTPTTLISSNEVCSRNASNVLMAESSSNDVDSDEAIPEFAYNKRVYHLDFPENTVKCGTKIEPFSQPSLLMNVDAVISIYITEIHNPFRFWFNVYKEHCELDDLMHTIQLFYKKMYLPNDYRIMRELIQPGQVCAAVYDNWWHRAEILTAISDEAVKVFFMDYGTVHSVNVNDIKYLRLEFAQQPAFACRGSLAEINPVGLHWSTISTQKLLTLTRDRLLHAKICEIDAEQRVFYLTICDTHKPKVVQINRALIDGNYALKSFEWNRSRQTHTPRLHHKREDYPTFDMLEKGDYPTLNEIFKMETLGINYETITDKMIYHTRIINFDESASKILRDLPFYLLSNNPFVEDIKKQFANEESDQNKN